MRIALISDIHGNLVTLEAVLADIQRQTVDRIICLGDVATLGPQHHEVLARLKALECPCIRGNHERFLLYPESVYTYSDDPAIIDSIHWCLDRLSDAELDYVHSFQPFIRVALDAENSLLCVHGSPRSDLDNIMATTPSEELDAMLAGHKDTLIASGHTHAQMVRQHRGMMLLNVGSVGQPFEQPLQQGPPHALLHAEYGIVTWDNGSLGIELRRVPFDLDTVKRIVLASNIPLRAWLIAQYAQ
jgi:putative phosphoesterase